MSGCAPETMPSWLPVQLRKLDRNREPPEDGPMCEMLWNDPMDGRGMVPNKVRLDSDGMGG